MPDRPHVLLSVATSIDGHVDDTTDARLLLSNAEDLERVDQVRSDVDAIMVGANTIRRDDPRLLVRSAERQAARVARGWPENPTKVTMTTSGDLDPEARFFTMGESPKLVYCPDDTAPELTGTLTEKAEVIAAGSAPLDPHRVLADLADRGVGRLMVEGGGTLHTLLLTHDVVDELHLVIAPFLIGDSNAPRFTHPATYPQDPNRPFRLADLQRFGDAVFLRYLRA